MPGVVHTLGQSLEEAPRRVDDAMGQRLFSFNRTSAAASRLIAPSA